MKKVTTDDGIRYEELSDNEYTLAIAEAASLGCAYEYSTHRGADVNLNVTLFNENRTIEIVEQFEAALAGESERDDLPVRPRED